MVFIIIFIPPYLPKNLCRAKIMNIIHKSFVFKNFIMRLCAKPITPIQE